MEEISGDFLKRIGTDGQKWAQEFIKLFGEQKEKIDEGLMIGWFCNAIMVGHDWGYKKGYDMGADS